MDPQTWLAELRTELQKRQLPRRYVTRLMRELSDHVMDAWENSMSKEDQRGLDPQTRLGSPSEVAQSAEQAYCSRTWAWRYPVLMFGLLPPIFFVALALGIYGLSATLLMTFSDSTFLEDIGSSPWLPMLAQGYFVSCLVLTSVIVSATFSFVARRFVVRRRWPMIAAVVVALLCGSLWSQVTIKTPEQMGRFSIGLSLASWPAEATLPRAIQFGAPLVVAFWLTRQKRATHLPMAT